MAPLGRPTRGFTLGKFIGPKEAMRMFQKSGSYTEEVSSECLPFTVRAGDFLHASSTPVCPVREAGGQQLQVHRVTLHTCFGYWHPMDQVLCQVRAQDPWPLPQHLSHIQSQGPVNPLRLKGVINRKWLHKFGEKRVRSSCWGQMFLKSVCVFWWCSFLCTLQNVLTFTE